MESVKLPKITNTAITTVQEVLAAAPCPPYQVTGVLLSGQGAVTEGTPMAYQTATGKFVKYAQGGSGGAEVCVGIARQPGRAFADDGVTPADGTIEVILQGIVKYSIVSAKANWHSGILTDLKARYVAVGDALIF